ncbi:hypothetical protein C8J56DRAFT_233227 [Mycena floridula]|nr:hypothetical protein C8J56DRAFT_233227 [Mycena floridula]
METVHTNGHTNGHINGNTNGFIYSPSSGPSTPAPTESFEDPSSSSGLQTYNSACQSHNEEILGHLYNRGFRFGEFADTVVHITNPSLAYNLHAIILCRSPRLAHLIYTSPQQPGGMRTIYVPLEQEPEITQEGFDIALCHLYSSESLNRVNPENARGVLAAACYLGGMDDLCQHAYDICSQSLSIKTVPSWIEFLEGISVPSSPNGTATPQFHLFGPYAQKIKDDVWHLLVVTLPFELGVKPGSEGREPLAQLLAQLPFEMFKEALESAIQFGSVQDQFQFAKEAIALRKRQTGVEETVVLAYGIGGNGGGVHITRKTKRRPLWKVGS